MDRCLLPLVWVAWSALLLQPGATAPPPQSEFFPLAVGTTWEYDAVLDPVIGGPRSGTATTMMERPVEMDGEDFVPLVTTVKGTPVGDVTEKLFYRRAPEGIVRRTADDAEASLFLPLNLAVGDRWETQVAGVELECRVVGLERVVAADGTTYERCLKIETRSRGNDGVQDATWLAPGTGVVKKSMKRPWYSIDILLRRVHD